MEIYLDNAATTAVYPTVVNIISDTLKNISGNPSSLHIKGVEAEKVIRNTDDILSGILKCRNDEIYYTSCATESNNMVIFGAAKARKRYGNHIITTQIEHPSVLEPIKKLEKEGFKVTYLKANPNGEVSADDLRNALCDQTFLVSIMYVNNETGAIQPVFEIGEIINKYNKDNRDNNNFIIYHIDAVQAFGKLKTSVSALKCDTLSISAHKFHGPKGVGALYLRKGVRILPLLYGGGQQSGQRPGTQNVAGIAGLGEAARISYDELEGGAYERTAGLRGYFKKFLEEIDGTIIHESTSKDVDAQSDAVSGNIPHILNVSFEGIKSEVLLHALEEEGIFVSSGSACSSNKPGLSYTLQSMGISRSQIESALRFSFDQNISEEQIERCCLVLKEKIPFLRMFTRK